MRAFLLGVVAGLLLASCGESLTVEQQIIATIRDMEVAAEAGEHLEFMGFVADGMQAQHGDMDRRAFHRFMIFQLNQHRRLQAKFFPIHVRELGAGRAEADFHVLVTGGGGLLPESGQVYAVETAWLADGGGWLLEMANWEPVQLPDIPSVMDIDRQSAGNRP
jgi:hypothetical protein